MGPLRVAEHWQMARYGRIMSHAWVATGIFPYLPDGYGNEGREKYICKNCGYETHRHAPPSQDITVPIDLGNGVIRYVPCEMVTIFEVTET